MSCRPSGFRQRVFAAVGYSPKSCDSALACIVRTCRWNAPSHTTCDRPRRCGDTASQTRVIVNAQFSRSLRQIAPWQCDRFWWRWQRKFVQSWQCRKNRITGHQSLLAPLVNSTECPGGFVASKGWGRATLLFRVNHAARSANSTTGRVQTFTAPEIKPAEHLRRHQSVPHPDTPLHDHPTSRPCATRRDSDESFGCSP